MFFILCVFIARKGNIFKKNNGSFKIKFFKKEVQAKQKMKTLFYKEQKVYNCCIPSFVCKNTYTILIPCYYTFSCLLKKRKDILKKGIGWYPFKGNNHLSLYPKEIMAERKALFPYFKIEDFNKPLWMDSFIIL